MVTTAALNTTLSIVDAAASALTSNVVAGNINRLAAHGAKAVSRLSTAGTALTAWTSQTTILSRMFVDESLLGEPVLPNLTKSLHEWYAAQVISALHLTQMVDGVRTVQDVMAIVQTGHNTREHGIIGNIAARRIGQESFLENYHGESFSTTNIGLEAIDYTLLDKDYKRARDQHKDEQEAARQAKQDVKEAEEAHRKFMQRDAAIRPVKVSENRIGPMGELFEVKLSNPNGNGVSITVPVFIQMQPSIIPQDIAPRFIDMNVPSSLWQRWTMMRAGELTFWRDFLLHADHARRQRSLLKDPTKAAAFADFLSTVGKKDKYALDDVTDQLGSRQSANLANSVMVLSEETVNQAKLDSGIDLHNATDRQRYFHNTYTMILVIVDPLHQRVTIYFNGLDGDINSSYNEFSPNNKHFDPKEFMGALQAFSTNNIGRMR